MKLHYGFFTPFCTVLSREKDSGASRFVSINLRTSKNTKPMDTTAPKKIQLSRISTEKKNATTSEDTTNEDNNRPDLSHTHPHQNNSQPSSTPTTPHKQSKNGKCTFFLNTNKRWINQPKNWFRRRKKSCDKKKITPEESQASPPSSKKDTHKIQQQQQQQPNAPSSINQNQSQNEATPNSLFDQMHENFQWHHSDKINFCTKNLEHIKKMIHVICMLEESKLVHTALSPDLILDDNQLIITQDEIIREFEEIHAYNPKYTCATFMKNLYRGKEEKKRYLTNKDDFFTFNRFSLGAMIMKSITDCVPSDKNAPAQLKLPTMSTAQGQDLCKRGYIQKELDSPTPKAINRNLSQYERTALSFAKHLMAEDRQHVMQLSLKGNLEQLEKALETAKAKAPPHKYHS